MTTRCWPLQVIRLGLSRHPLCRRSDRIEAAVLLLAALSCVAALPLAGLVGGVVQERSEAEAAASDLRPRVATLLDAPAGPTTLAAAQPPTAEVAWTGPDGRAVRASVPVPRTAVRGSEVTVWTTDDGRLADPPLTASQVEVRVTLAAAGTQLGAMALVAVALVGARRAVERRRYRDWNTGWMALDPTHPTPRP